MIARRLGALAVTAAMTTATGCADGDDVEAFCDAAEVTVDAGPLFPDRTDGEPVPNPAALDALEQLADDAPDDIADEVDVLLAEARALVAEATERAERDGPSTTATTLGPRPARAEVDTAQSAVVAYASDECGIDLTSEA